MKRLIASLLVLGGVALFVSGCKTKEEPPAVPEVEAPAAPKDHPAH